jgi:hypothetical protein
MYNPVNTSHEIFDLAKTWGEGHEISDTTGSNSGYWFLGMTLSVNTDCYVHYLPADTVRTGKGAQSHVTHPVELCICHASQPGMCSLCRMSRALN